MDQSQNDLSAEFTLQVGGRRGSTCSIATQTRPNATHPVLSLRSSRICCKHCFHQSVGIVSVVIEFMPSGIQFFCSYSTCGYVVDIVVLLLKYCCCRCFFSVFFLSFVDVEIIFSLQAALNARYLEQQQQQQQQLKSLSSSRSPCIFEALPSYKGTMRQ